jgi:hypothetical protein
LKALGTEIAEHPADGGELRFGNGFERGTGARYTASRAAKNAPLLSPSSNAIARSAETAAKRSALKLAGHSIFSYVLRARLASSMSTVSAAIVATDARASASMRTSPDPPACMRRCALLNKVPASR